MPTTVLAQQTWDRAAAGASAGRSLAALEQEAVDTAAPTIDAEVSAAIPAHGRTFWLSVCKALIWAVAVDVTLLVFGSSSAHPVPGLTVLICTAAVVLAAGFGVTAGNHRVRQRRIRHGQLRREGIRRLAASAARTAWAAQVPGDWAPAGPVPPVGERAPARAWLLRLGDADQTVLGVDGGAPPSRGDRPVACFVRDPDTFADPVREAADARGVALFVVGGDRLYPMSAAASAVWAAYRSIGTSSAPAGLIPRAGAVADQRTGNTR